MELAVKLFGPEARACGRSTIHVRVATDATSADVLRALGEAEPALRSSMNVLRLAVNHEFAGPGMAVSALDELALIGLVGGG